ncbi:MAG: bifunctional folylpolyglutamate synthase/dihydrofolate synthase [Labilithrix sp.]|nr:bifunctional folylpolyglutamate synthase/dihydrofolate synthase [Labilithrix sp.]
MRLGLEPMRAACARAGHPERAFEVVHVAGTNGKGSTCAMVEAMARASGRRTGLYTSPHLVRFAERIRVDGEPVADDTLTSALEEALHVGSELSFFETATFAALLAFRAAAVELAVLEVGLGGRLDATNVVPAPRVTAVTGIALDHQEMLGDTLDAIAREKAAIAKPGVPMVLGAMPDEARAAALEVAIAAGARVVDAAALPPDVTVGLAGAHQRENARVAWTIGAELGLADDARRRGLAEARWPGRLERVEVREGELAGPWLLDGAHNPDGARALVRALDGAGEDVGAVVFGALEDKAWREMLGVIAGGMAAPRVYVAPAGRVAAELEALRGIAEGRAAASVAEALRAARAAAGRRGVVVCGSLYLVGEARAALLGLARDPAVAL